MKEPSGAEGARSQGEANWSTIRGGAEGLRGEAEPGNPHAMAELVTGSSKVDLGYMAELILELNG